MSVGLLCDREITELCLIKSPMIEPFIFTQVRQVYSSIDLAEKKVISFGLSSFGYDVRIDREFKIFTDVDGTVVDPKAFDERAFVTRVVDEFVIIPPHSFVLGKSVERFQMPEDVTGICLGKSTYARCGLVVNVTPLEAGWIGYVTIEISNTTPLPAKVYVKEGIMQVLFFRGSRPDVTYANRPGGSKYQNQEGIVPAKV